MSMQGSFRKYLSATAATAAIAFGTGSATALPVNGTGNVTSNVIMGSGITNGSWTGVNVDGLELALRGKLRYDAAMMPQNIFNYDGDRTYTFDPSLSTIPVGRSVFNFEYSVNTDANTPNSPPNRNLDAFTYLFQYDLDPSAGTSFINAFDVIRDKTDNAYGNNDTAESAGAVGTFAALGATNNLAQNSQNLGFFPFNFLDPGFLNPQTPGLYTYNLIASDTNGEVARTSIDIRVLPEPGTLALFGLGLLGLGLARRKRSV